VSTAAPAGLASSSLFTRVSPGSAPEGAQVMRQFPPRERAAWWPGTAVGAEEARALLTAPPFRLGSRGGQQQRGRVLGQVLHWLGGQPGCTWQERWAASGGQDGAGWREIAARWLDAAGRAPAGGPGGGGLGTGLLLMICGDLIRPDAGWLLASSGLLLSGEMARTRDPGAFAALRRACEAEQVSPLTRDLSLRRIAAIMAAKGGLVRDITAGDCMELAATAKSVEGKTRSTGMHFYQLLRAAGVLPPETPASVRMFATRGQLTPDELTGQYGIECAPVRSLLTDYLRERHLAADYSTLRTIAHILGKLFWRDLELHHPGISSLRLSPAQVAGWKDRITRKTPRGAAGGPESPRTAAANALFTVRAFYLDIAQWAVDDPSRWAQWAAPCPVRAEEIPHAKELSRRKARMDQRTRERLPVLPVLVRSAEDGRHAAAERLAACAASAPGETFTAGGQELRRAVTGKGGTARTWAEDPKDGRRRDRPSKSTGPSGPGPRSRSCVIPASGSRSSPSCRTTAWFSTCCRPPASSSRCCRSPRPRPTPNGSWSSAPNWPTSCRRSSPGSAATTAPSRSSSPTTTTRNSGTRRCRCCSSAGSGQRTGPSPPRRSGHS
jgi:hypothetical protein